MDNTIKNILIFFMIVLIFYLISVLASILIPFVLALMLAILFQPLVKFLIRKNFPKWLILPTVAGITLLFLVIIGFILTNTATQILEEKNFLLSRLLLKLDGLLNWINDVFNLQLDSTSVVARIYTNIQKGWLADLFGNIAKQLGSFAGGFFWFALYYVMLLSGISGFDDYLHYVGDTNSDSLKKEYSIIEKSIVSFIWLKTILSIFVGSFTVIFCLIFGIKFAFFWGFVAMMMNFIPSIGSIVGSGMPILMGVVQLDSYQAIIVFTLLNMVMHFSIGNFVEPIVMGGQLRLNTITVILGLVFWGFLWGIPGMLLAVPLLVIMKIVMERFPSLSIVSRLMGYPDRK